MPKTPTDLAGAPEKRIGGPNLAAGRSRPSLVQKVAIAIGDRMEDLDLIFRGSDGWVHLAPLMSTTYAPGVWQRILEYLAKAALEEVEISKALDKYFAEVEANDEAQKTA